MSDPRDEALRVLISLRDQADHPDQSPCAEIRFYEAAVEYVRGMLASPVRTYEQGVEQGIAEERARVVALLQDLRERYCDNEGCSNEAECLLSAIDDIVTPPDSPRPSDTDEALSLIPAARFDQLMAKHARGEITREEVLTLLEMPAIPPDSQHTPR